MKTNLKSVKQVAHKLLNVDISETKFPFIVSHPFTSNPYQFINGEFIDITEEENAEKWRTLIHAEIEKAESSIKVYLLINRPYKVLFLDLCKDHLNTEEFSELLADAWTDDEMANINNTSLDMVDLFKRCDKKHLMDEDELFAFENLDSVQTIYRGVTSKNNKNENVMSWTISYDVADWFAHRFGQCGDVWQARIKKEDILAYFDCRNEAEVVVNPDKIIWERGSDSNENTC